MRQELNEYLFYEFGCDLAEPDIEKVKEDWPFVLEEAGTIDLGGTSEHIFVFEDKGEKFYAIYGRALEYFPVAGIDLANLRRQFLGSAWIARRKPMDLEVVRLGDPRVPSTSERRKRIEELARGLEPDKPVKILKGLLLESTGEYLALVQFGEEATAHAVGDRMRVRNIPFQQASASRRLSIAIGKLIEDGRLD
ncbi:MAG: hypothetical protein ACYSUP_14030 [Planctomycetota bacterium]